MMEEAPKVRRIRPEDRQEWVRMRDALWPGWHDDHERETVGFFAKPDPRLATFVVERPGGGLGGFLEAGWRNIAEMCTSSPVAYIEGWYVDPDLRRRGIGRALVRAAEAWARSEGYSEMASDAVIANEVSIQAHLAFGYEEVERIVCFRKHLGDGRAESHRK